MPLSMTVTSVPGRRRSGIGDREESPNVPCAAVQWSSVSFSDRRGRPHPRTSRRRSACRATGSLPAPVCVTFPGSILPARRCLMDTDGRTRLARARGPRSEQKTVANPPSNKGPAGPAGDGSKSSKDTASRQQRMRLPPWWPGLPGPHGGQLRGDAGGLPGAILGYGVPYTFFKRQVEAGNAGVHAALPQPHAHLAMPFAVKRARRQDAGPRSLTNGEACLSARGSRHLPEAASRADLL